MKILISSLVALSMVTAVTINVQGQNTQKKTTIMQTTSSIESQQVVQNFFNSFAKGDRNGIINSFHDSCTIVAVRKSYPGADNIYGTYTGIGGLKTFLSNLGNVFDTKAFTVEQIVGAENVCFANGNFLHMIKATGKSYASDWALMCRIKDSKIIEYHFYEDSAKFEEASQ